MLPRWVLGRRDLGRSGWDRGAPLPMRDRLAATAEIFGGLALVIVALGALARASDLVLRSLVG